MVLVIMCSACNHHATALTLAAAGGVLPTRLCMDVYMPRSRLETANAEADAEAGEHITPFSPCNAGCCAICLLLFELLAKLLLPPFLCFHCCRLVSVFCFFICMAMLLCLLQSVISSVQNQ